MTQDTQEQAMREELVKSALGCFTAAEVEGLHDRLANTSAEEQGDPISLYGLLTRRILYAADFLRQALSAQGGVVPEGYMLVPIEPTEEMLAAGFLTTRYDEGHGTRCDVYRAMLAASPKQRA